MKKNMPEELENICNGLPFEVFCKQILKLKNEYIDGQEIYVCGYKYPYNNICRIESDTLYDVGDKFFRSDLYHINSYRLKKNTLPIINKKYLVYFKNGNQFVATLETKREFKYMYGLNKSSINYSIGSWKIGGKLFHRDDYILLNTKEDIISEIESLSPYLLEYMETSNCSGMIKENPEILLMAPQIEQLEKAGYAVIKSIFGSPTEINEFSRLCRPGKNMKEIFKTSKAVYKSLKNCPDISTWNSIRMIDKKTPLSEERVNNILNLGLDSKNLEYVKDILRFEYNGKLLFSWESLIRYLERLDAFEAIEKDEALQLLKDYLQMCKDLDMRPRIDGDSLKREHDIAARLVRRHSDEIMASKMKKNCEEMKKYDYEENVFFIRGIRSYDDLIDEAKQQHNCVAGYSGYIASGRSYIYVMREKAHPNKSLITIELSPDKKEIRQKYMAYNKPIHSKAQSEFISRWIKNKVRVA